MEPTVFSIPCLGLYPQTTLYPTDKAGAPHLPTGLVLSKMRPLNQLLASFAPPWHAVGFTSRHALSLHLDATGLHADPLTGRLV